MATADRLHGVLDVADVAVVLVDLVVANLPAEVAGPHKVAIRAIRDSAYSDWDRCLRSPDMAAMQAAAEDRREARLNAIRAERLDDEDTHETAARLAGRG